MRCSIKKRNLPPSPKPTRPTYVKEVQGLASKHLEVREAKPAVTLDIRKKRRTPSAAIAVSAQRRSDAKKQRKEEAIRLWESGMTIEEIAEYMEVKPGAIYDYTRDIREVINRGKIHEYDDEIIRMYNEGMKYKDIAAALGITKENVSDKLARLRKHGQVGRRSTWTR